MFYDPNGDEEMPNDDRKRKGQQGDEGTMGTDWDNM